MKKLIKDSNIENLNKLIEESKKISGIVNILNEKVELDISNFRMKSTSTSISRIELLKELLLEASKTTIKPF